MAYIPDIGNIETFVRAVGYPGLFAAVFAETGIFFMFFLPGSSMLFTAGLLASHGLFNVWLLLPLITLAAILGDSTGYWFGTKVGPALFKREDSGFFRKSHVEKTRIFYEKHGVLAVVLARFVPIVRTFAPILAGVAGMRYRIFLSYNIAGGILWGAGVTFSGYFLGETFPQVDSFLTPIILAIIITSFIPLINEWYKSRTKKAREPTKRMSPTSGATKCPSAVLFDLDNTIAESFKPPAPEIASRLYELLKRMPVAIMSGASFSRMEKDLLPALPKDADLSCLYLFPDTAAQCYIFESGAWKSAYKFAFTQKEYDGIMQAFKEAIEETGVLQGVPRWGELFLARDVQVTFAGLGVDAPPDMKAVWDPARAKREKLKKILDPKLPGMVVRISGRTAIDITAKKIDKAHGVKWLAKRLGVKPSEMLFVGDDLSPGGNDAVVIPTGIQTMEVKGPRETAKVISDILSQCSRS